MIWYDAQASVVAWSELNGISIIAAYASSELILFYFLDIICTFLPIRLIQSLQVTIFLYFVLTKERNVLCVHAVIKAPPKSHRACHNTIIPYFHQQFIKLAALYNTTALLRSVHRSFSRLYIASEVAT